MLYMQVNVHEHAGVKVVAEDTIDERFCLSKFPSVKISWLIFVARALHQRNLNTDWGSVHSQRCAYIH